MISRSQEEAQGLYYKSKYALFNKTCDNEGGSKKNTKMRDVIFGLPSKLFFHFILITFNIGHSLTFIFLRLFYINIRLHMQIPSTLSYCPKVFPNICLNLNIRFFVILFSSRISALVRLFKKKTYFINMLHIIVFKQRL